MKYGLLAAAMLLTSAAIAQHHIGKSDDKATFAAMYRTAENAFEAKNYKGIYDWTTSDFTEKSMGKTYNRAQSMAGLKQFLGMFSTVHCKFTMTNCKVNGDSATSTDAVHVWGPMKDPKTKKTHQLDARRNEAMTWSKKGNRWMLKSIIATDEKMSMDGKPMPMQAPSK